MTNEPSLSPDDPLLTAYALGELDGPECATVEAALAANPALRSVVDNIRATADQLELALAAEPAPAHSAVVVPTRPRARVVRFPVAYYIIGGLAAASFAVMVLREEPRVHSSATPEGSLVHVDLEKTAAPDTENETKVSEPALARAEAPEVKLELPRDPAARYYLGLAYAARGQSARALQLWESLVAEMPPSPLRSELVDRVAALKARAGAGRPDISAMVAGLAARLQTNPNDPEGWQRLIRAYSVLGEEDKARQALAGARTALKGFGKSATQGSAVDTAQDADVSNSKAGGSISPDMIAALREIRSTLAAALSR